MPRKSKLDEDIERVDRGETGVSEDDEIVDAPFTKGRTTVITPVRIPAGKWSELRQEADELGVGVSTLIRMWVLERLRRKKARSA